MSYHIIVHLSSHITIHINSYVNNVCDIYVCYRNWAWVELGGLKLIL
jgi:hypothetical protein